MLRRGFASQWTAPTGELVDRVFVPSRRIGWEFVPPQPPTASPDLARQPVWREMYPSDLRSLMLRRATAIATRPARVGWSICTGAVGLLLLFTANSSSVLFPLASLGAIVGLALSLLLGALAVFPLAVADYRIEQERGRWTQQRNQHLRSFEEAQGAWRLAVDAHNAAEQHRMTTSDLWYPLDVPRDASQLDVFGGNGAGWASLVATFGGGAIADGLSVTVLDLTDEAVGGALAWLAAARRIPVRQTNAVAERRILDILDVLDPQDLGTSSPA